MSEIKLMGVNTQGEQVNYGKDVSCFIHRAYNITVTLKDENTVCMSTPKGVYDLIKHPSQNYYWGKCNGHKVHVILKKIVGKIIYWD